MDRDNGGITELTLEQCRRIDQVIIMEVALAVENNNWAFIDRIGMDHDAARLIHGMSNGTTSAIVQAVRGGIFSLQTDNRRLTNLLNLVGNNATRVRQCRQLIDRGATREMCQQLGFAVTRAELAAIAEESGKSRRGRPPTMSPSKFDNCLTYWRSIRSPERHDPIDLLLQTCDHLDVHAISIWGFIGPQSAGFTTDVSTYGYDTPVQDRPWVRVMFPKWSAP